MPDIDDLIEAYRAGATINQLPSDFGLHRTTVADQLDRHRIPRHHELTAWVRHEIDAGTVAIRFRRAGIVRAG